MRLIKTTKLPMARQAFINLGFGLSLFLVIPVGCSKDVLEKTAATNSDLKGMRLPVLSSFTINSKFMSAGDSPIGRLNARKKNDANVLSGSNPGNVSWITPDGPGVTLGPGLEFIYLRQQYKSQMFTIADQSMALNIYPGAMLDGRSIDGMFNPKMLLGISQNIRPVTISTSIPASSSVIAKTSLPRPIAERALTNAALTDLEALSPDGMGAAALTVEVDSFKVYDELKTMYGYNKSIDVLLVGANTIKKGETHFVNSKSALKVKFFQENFTIDLDLPKTHNELFDPAGLNMPVITGGVTPVFVSSVIYGRMGIMLIESEYSGIKLYSAVKKQVDILRNLIGIDKNMTEEEKIIINSASIRVKYTGVNADTDAMIKVNGLSGFIDIISANKTYSKESPGVPVAFQLTYFDADQALVAAPFQINYGPYDRPYVKFKFENIQETYQSPWRSSGDLYAYFYKDQAGTIAYNNVPDFVTYPYNMVRNSTHVSDYIPRYETRTVPYSFKIKHSGYRFKLGLAEISYYVKYGSDANTSRTDFSYNFVPNGYFLLAN